MPKESKRIQNYDDWNREVDVNSNLWCVDSWGTTIKKWTWSAVDCAASPGNGNVYEKDWHVIKYIRLHDSAASCQAGQGSNISFCTAEQRGCKSNFIRIIVNEEEEAEAEEKEKIINKVKWGSEWREKMCWCVE